jgi:hypothetical protein
LRGVVGFLNTECNVRFDVCLPEISQLDSSGKFLTVKDSKAQEKGVGMKFEDSKYNEAEIHFTDILNQPIDIFLKEVATKPLVKIYCKIPKPELLTVSEFFLEGYFEIQKVNLAGKRTILGEDLETKLKEKNKISIEQKLFIEIIGKPLIATHEIETEFGVINRVKPKLNVEI